MVQSSQSGASTRAWKHDDPNLPILFERYQILGVLGQGGMGTVLKGYHLNLKRHVAIKTLRIDHRQSQNMVGRFLKEMQAVGQMDHPNVVRASDAGEKNGVFYLVMEYLRGSDLARLATQKGRLEIAAACELTRQAALGLEHIHQTLVHRDIKPSNMMLTTAGQVKILDLGLARPGFGELVDRERTPDGFPIGTYAFMAPEQAMAGADIDGRADIYSLGCTLFKFLTGHAPYSGPGFDNAARIIHAHCHLPLTEVKAFESVPDALRGLLLKMMAKKPDDRFRSALEVVDALAPFGTVNSLVPLLGLDVAEEPTSESPVQPLPWPLPEEISRLTAPPYEETPPIASGLIGAARISAKSAWRRPRLLWAAGACILVAAIALPFWLTAPTPMARQNAVELVGWRNLDDLPPRTHHFLLDQKPFPIGAATGETGLFRWDKSDQVVNVHDDAGKLLLILGKTTRPRFSFEAAISQAPWSGDVGIFWGYREDASKKKDESYKANKTHGEYFATFQMLKLVHERGPNEEHLYFVSRVAGQLRHNKQGEIAAKIFNEAQQSVQPPRNGIALLEIEVAEDRPKVASMNGFLLTDLYGAEADRNFPPQSCEGGLGLISLSHTATFRNARFIMHTVK